MRNHGPPDDGQAYENGPGCELGQTYEFERTYEFEQINKTAAISECLCETALSRKGLTPTIALTGMIPPTTALTGIFLYRARWTAFLGSTGRGFAGLSRPSAIWKCHRPHFCWKITADGDHFTYPPAAFTEATWIFGIIDIFGW